MVCYDADIDYRAWNGWMWKEGVGKRGLERGGRVQDS